MAQPSKVRRIGSACQGRTMWSLCAAVGAASYALLVGRQRNELVFSSHWLDARIRPRLHFNAGGVTMVVTITITTTAEKVAPSTMR